MELAGDMTSGRPVKQVAKAPEVRLAEDKAIARSVDSPVSGPAIMAPSIPVRNVEAISAELRRANVEEPQETKTAKSSKSKLVFTSNQSSYLLEGKTYTVLRFPDGDGPSFSGSIEIARLADQNMMTVQLAKEIIGNEDLSQDFLYLFKPGEWTYIRDRETEAYASYSANFRHLREHHEGRGEKYDQLAVRFSQELSLNAPTLILVEE